MSFYKQKYSIRSFLESPNPAKEETSPLDLSVKVTRSENINSTALVRPCENIAQIFSNSASQFLLSQNFQICRNVLNSQYTCLNLYRYFEDLLRCGTGTNMMSKPTLKMESQIASSKPLESFLNVSEQPLPFITDSFLISLFASQNSTKAFPEVHSRSQYKLTNLESVDKVSKAYFVKGVCHSPIGSFHKRNKRTKITDSRLLEGNAINLSANQWKEDTLHVTVENHCSSTSQSSRSEEIYNDPKKYTLTRIHLRKAKLMFLFKRYPNSQMLKNYFPDIVFYKQNTAQLVKWFSTFRQFYYSEMEKAVQRSMSDSVSFSSDILVSEDCELFKNLITHFNKNRHIEVRTHPTYAVDVWSIREDEWFKIADETIINHYISVPKLLVEVIGSKEYNLKY